MVLPAIIAAGAIGPTLLVILGIVLLFLVTDKTEVAMVILGIIVLAYLTK